jgi:hypothetical protein
MSGSPLDGNPDTRMTGLGCPVTLVSGHSFYIFYVFWRELIFFLFLFLSLSVHTVWVLFSLINFTKVNCEG